MAKNVTKPVHVHVSKNVKTPAQKEKAIQNAAAAAQRLERLQAVQADAREGRKLGFTGLTDQIVADKYQAHLAAQAAAAKEVELRGKVNEILSASGTYRKRIEGFLAGRIKMEASFVLQKINDFMSRPRNADVKAYVDKVMELRTTPVTMPVENKSEAAA